MDWKGINKNEVCMDEINIAVFQERLTEKIKESGLKQKELADLVGVTEVALSRYLTYPDRLPKTAVLANIATALHTTTDYLLGRDENIGFAEIKRMIARKQENFTDEERKELQNLLGNINKRLEMEEKI